MNAADIELGDEMTNFKAFCMEFDADSRGLAIGNSDSIRTAHNSFARNDSFLLEESKQKSGKGEAHHFIAYVPHNGSIYELDGLKAGPICIGSFEGSDWMAATRPAIEARMARYSQSETHFALMSIGRSAIARLEAQANAVRQELAPLDESPERSSLFQQLELIESQLSEENFKLKCQREENARRKHNFIPFIMKLLLNLASKGKLDELRESAKERSAASNRNRAAVKQL